MILRCSATVFLVSECRIKLKQNGQEKKVTHPTGINWSNVGINYQSTRNRLDRTKSHLSKLLDQTVQAELEMKDRFLNNIAQFTAQVQKLSAEHDVASPEVCKDFLFGHSVGAFHCTPVGPAMFDRMMRVLPASDNLFLQQQPTVPARPCELLFRVFLLKMTVNGVKTLADA